MRSIIGILMAVAVAAVTSAVVLIACRLRWDMSTPKQQDAMRPGGENDLGIWAIVLGVLIVGTLSNVGRRG